MHTQASFSAISHARSASLIPDSANLKWSNVNNVMTTTRNKIVKEKWVQGLAKYYTKMDFVELHTFENECDRKAFVTLVATMRFLLIFQPARRRTASCIIIYLVINPNLKYIWQYKSLLASKFRVYNLRHTVSHRARQTGHHLTLFI